LVAEDAELKQAIEEHAATITQEVLAVGLTNEAPVKDSAAAAGPGSGEANPGSMMAPGKDPTRVKVAGKELLVYLQKAGG
jgi:hypothetical protein